MEWSCCGGTRTGGFAAFSRAAAKSAASRLRRLGLLPESVDWSRRAAICEACPLRTIHRGVSYCGRPFLQQTDRDPAAEGCGCPTHAKAKSPDEHCPIDRLNRGVTQTPADCTCKWCQVLAA
jgi:hypothetical protein